MFRLRTIFDTLTPIYVSSNQESYVGAWLQVWIFHGEKRFQTLLNTVSPGTASTSPERSSEIRFLAIAAHFLSMSESGGLRLLRMESTTIALSSIGSEIASAIKSFVFNLAHLSHSLWRIAIRINNSLLYRYKKYCGPSFMSRKKFWFTSNNLIMVLSIFHFFSIHKTNGSWAV